MQAGIMVLPLITVPYLIRVLGIEKFGLISFAQSVVMIFGAFADFGINLYAPGKLGMVRNDETQLPRLFWSIINIRNAAIFVSMILAVVTIQLVPRFHGEPLLFYGSLFYVVSTYLFPSWFFQGMEQMAKMAVINFVSRLISVLGVFVFVRSADDYWLVPFVQGGVPAVFSVASIIYVLIAFKVGFCRISLKEHREYLKEILPVFVSNVSICLYTTFNPVILGFVAGNAAVGYFTGAQRLINAAMSLVQTQINQVFYPFISRKLSVSKADADRSMGVSFTIMLLVSTVMAFVMFTFAYPIVRFVLGDAAIPSAKVLMIAAPVILMIGVSNVLGVQGLLAYGRRRDFAKIVMIGSIINICLTLFFGWKFAQIGASIGWLAAEFYIVLHMAVISDRSFLMLLPKRFFVRYSFYFALSVLVCLAAYMMPAPAALTIVVAGSLMIFMLFKFRLVWFRL